MNLDTDRLDTTYTYDAFGNTTANFLNPAEPGSEQFSYLYAGMEYDSAYNLYHTPARLYNPQLRRFVSEDPVFGTNLFSYAGNSPANATDPSGMFPDGAVLAASFEVGGGYTSALDIPGILMAWQGGPNALQSIVQGIFGGGGRSVPQKAPLIAGQNGAIDKGGASPLVLVSMTDDTENQIEIWQLKLAWNVGRVAFVGAGELFRALAWYLVTENHHLLPLEFADRFKARGLDPESYTIRLLRSDHRLSPNGLHTGSRATSWNGQWNEFFKSNPAATKPEILDQLRQMCVQYRLACWQ